MVMNPKSSSSVAPCEINTERNRTSLVPIVVNRPSPKNISDAKRGSRRVSLPFIHDPNKSSTSDHPEAKILKQYQGSKLTPRTATMQASCDDSYYIETFKVSNKTDDNGNQMLNQYLFHEELGRGAYSTAFKVTDTEDGKIYAVKIANKKDLRRKRIGRFGSALESVATEIAIWKTLHHPNIVRLHELINSDSSEELYMVSEYVSGGQVVAEKNYFHCSTLPEDICKSYFAQLITGISFLHFHSIIHRDIKPSNLLLEDGVLKITDFGVSHLLSDPKDDLMRKTAGTAPFLAPEMLSGSAFHGKPIDYWAAGVTLYMFVYGSPPFIAASIPDLYAAIKKDSPVILPAVNSEGVTVSADLIDLLSRILDKNPTTRYTSIDAIKKHPWMKDAFDSCSAAEVVADSNTTSKNDLITSSDSYQKVKLEENDIEKAITPLTFFGMLAARRLAAYLNGQRKKPRIVPYNSISTQVVDAAVAAGLATAVEKISNI